ncbi:MAG TPA: VOC family protein [Dehalococcoidia bacterium]|nr:VOC family protein [Dehalococcoidia bacterium]
MIKGLAGATIWSEDLGRLLPFYRDTLGLEVQMEAPGFVLLGQAGAPKVALGTHSDVHGQAKEPARHILSLDTDDIHGDYQRLSGTGVEFLEAPTAGPGGDVAFATFKDPEGNYLQLVQFSDAR